MSEPDEQRQFTEACLHGLRARLCDVDALDSYLPPHDVAALARKIAGAPEAPQRPPRDGGTAASLDGAPRTGPRGRHG
ncbi:hypothetical protein [Streptomyces sp. NPDC021356]|uniref:hypothetical protein n=1 Tax=Streptomyces sp. NPDC021356 TaxID=3154900 RepID=UPI00340A968C